MVRELIRGVSGWLGLAALLVPVATAVSCAEDNGGAAVADDDRPAIGKADLTGSCSANTCEGPSSDGNCWCDESCQTFGDCCANAFDACGVGDRPCADGSSLNPLCDQKPPCEDGQVAAVINGCFECVDEMTCEAPPQSCDDGSTLSQFCDQKPPCEDGQVAAVIGGCFECVDEMTCEPAPQSCDDGSTLSQFCDQKPPCEDGQVAAVISGCFECVDEMTCEAPPQSCDDGSTLSQ
ncbi:MAG: hypothetical protein JKY37_13975, partial [Nannocystaceae bacterium]|nr:hypothetical protein [Nannocystaceae bacterium]